VVCVDQYIIGQGYYW